MARRSPSGTGSLAYRIKPAYSGKVKFFAWVSAANELQVLYSNSTATTVVTRSGSATFDATNGCANGAIATTGKFAVTPPSVLGLNSHEDMFIQASYYGNQYLGFPGEVDDLSATQVEDANGPKIAILNYTLQAATFNDHYAATSSVLSQDEPAKYATIGARFNYSHPTIKEQLWIDGVEETGERGNATLTTGTPTVFGGPSNPIYMGASQEGSPTTQRQIGCESYLLALGTVSDSEAAIFGANPFDVIEATPSNTFSSINVTLSSASVNEGNTITATATVTGSTGVMPGRVVNFSSSDTGKATVPTGDVTTDVNGVVTRTVTGVAAGTTVINATDAAAATADATPPTLTVASVVGFGSITVALGAASLPVGGTTTVTATVLGSDSLPMVGRAVTFTSGTTATGTVSGNGNTNASGQVVGTFTAVAAGTSSITATDTAASTTSSGQTATVVADVSGGGGGTGTFGTSPAITTASLASGTELTAYSQTLAATGDTPITWSNSGAIPAGLTLNVNTGALTGTPTNAGDYTFTIIATNAAGSDSKVFTISIAAAPAPATMTLVASLGGETGTFNVSMIPPVTRMDLVGSTGVDTAAALMIDVAQGSIALVAQTNGDAGVMSISSTEPPAVMDLAGTAGADSAAIRVSITARHAPYGSRYGSLLWWLRKRRN